MTDHFLEDKRLFKALEKRDQLDKDLLRRKWKEYRSWKKKMDRIPNADPILKPQSRPDGYTGVFRLQSCLVKPEELLRRHFNDRNKTFRRKFEEYVTQLVSILVEPRFDHDEIVETDENGTEVYSLDLKFISRNYSDFNKVLLKERLLEVTEQYDREKKKCRRYDFPSEVLNKGIEKRFLTTDELRSLNESVRVDDGPDRTPSPLSPLLGYYLEVLKGTKIDPKDFSELEIELGRFRKLYPGVIRHNQGRYDLKLGPKEGRLYSIYLYSPREFRRLIRFKGQEMVEGDVGASHFHFFLDRMTDPKEREMMKDDLKSSDPYLSMCGNPDPSLRSELKRSSHKFKYGNRKINPKVFEDVLNPSSLVYTHGLFFRHLSKKYPVFSESMARMEINHWKHRSDFACSIMSKESDVMVQMMGNRCRKEKLVYLPIHDGFLTLPSQFDRVCELVTECFQKTTGSVPLIRRK